MEFSEIGQQPSIQSNVGISQTHIWPAYHFSIVKLLRPEMVLSSEIRYKRRNDNWRAPLLKQLQFTRLSNQSFLLDLQHDGIFQTQLNKASWCYILGLKALT